MSNTDEDPKKRSASSKSVPEESEDNIQYSISFDEKGISKLLSETVVALGGKDLLRESQIAINYIDNRSSGILFNADVNIEGDVVGRDQNKRRVTNRAKSQPSNAVNQILVNDLKKIKTVYVQVQKYQLVYKALSDQNLIILRGTNHIGKFTSALHMLNVLHDHVIFELDPASSFKTINLSNSYNQGFVIDSYTPDKIDDLTLFNLNQLSNRLIENKAHLVITIDDRLTLPNSEEIRKYLFTWDELPDTKSTLKKHLEWYARDPLIQKIAIDYCVRDDIQSVLHPSLMPTDVDRLAQMLVDVASKKYELSFALENFRTRTGELVAKWFEDNLDLRDRTFLISAAVYAGSSYRVVIDAEKELLSLLPKDEQSNPNFQDPFGLSRSRRLQNVGVKLKLGVEETEFGSNPVEIVELNNPAMQSAVLKYLWREKDGLRDVLIRWLSSAVIDSPYEVRMRAAAAVGELSKQDFRLILNEIIIPWSKHFNFSVRMSAAFSLGIPAWESEIAPLVLGLLHHWCTLKNNWRLSWTAAAAYGGLVGVRFPDAALRDLYQIAKTGDIRLIDILLWSIRNLFCVGETESEYRKKIIDTLAEWAGQTDDVAGVAGLFTFLYLADTVKTKADNGRDDYPVLLDLLDDEALGYKIIEMWRKSFNLKITRSAAHTIIDKWVKVVARDTRLYDKFNLLVEKISSSKNEREVGRFISYIRQWREHSELAPIAGRILQGISKEIV